MMISTLNHSTQSLQCLKKYVPEISCFDDILKVLSPKTEERLLIPNVQILIELLLINPATSATPERSFSLARRIKTWLRSSMAQKRFNGLAILSEHKLVTDKIDLMKVANVRNARKTEKHHL